MSPRGPRPPLSTELVALPRSTATWARAGVDARDLRGPLFVAAHRGSHQWLPVDPADAMIRIHAVLALMHPGTALGGWAALRWLGVTRLDGRCGPGGDTLLPVTVSTGPVGRMRPRPGLVTDRSTLLEVDLTESAGVLVTTAERSCLDIMRRLGPEEGLVAADAAVRAGLTTPARLEAALGRQVGLPGVPRARLAVPLVDGRAESAPESRLRYVWVVQAGLPRPLVNPTVTTLTGRFVARTDLLEPDGGTVAEYDGGAHRDPRRHTSDNAREEELEGLNLEVTRATAIDLFTQRPRLVRRLQAAHQRGRDRDRALDAWAYARTDHP